MGEFFDEPVGHSPVTRWISEPEALRVLMDVCWLAGVVDGARIPIPPHVNESLNKLRELAGVAPVHPGQAA